MNEIHILGDRVKDETGELQLSIHLEQLKGGDMLRVYSQQGIIFEKAFTDEINGKRYSFNSKTMDIHYYE